MINKKEWTSWLEIKGLSSKTIEDYNGYFDKLDSDNLNHQTLNDFMRRYNNGVARAMLKNLLTYIRTNQEGFELLLIELSKDFEIPKITGRKKKKELKILTIEQVQNLSRQCPDREKFMVLLTFYLGLRSAELLSLTIKSFDWKNSKVKVIGKGNKERVLPVLPLLAEKLIEYINTQIEKDPDFEILFNVSDRLWRKKLKNLSKKTIGLDVNPHLLRHSCGTFLHRQGLDLKEIADFLGHASIITTQIYTHIDKRQLNEKVINAFQ